MPTCFKNQCDHEVRMILAFLPHAISLFLVICFELLITRTFFLESSSYRWSTVFPDLLAGCFGPSCPTKRHPYYVRNESVYINFVHAHTLMRPRLYPCLKRSRVDGRNTTVCVYKLKPTRCGHR